MEPNSDCCEIFDIKLTPSKPVPSMIRLPSTEIDISELILTVVPSSIVSCAPDLIIISLSISLVPDHYTEVVIVSAPLMPICVIGTILIINIVTRNNVTLRPCIDPVKQTNEMSVTFN